MQNICKLIAENSDLINGTNDFHVEELEDFASASTSVDEIINGDRPYTANGINLLSHMESKITGRILPMVKYAKQLIGHLLHLTF